MLSIRWACPVVLAVACGSPSASVTRAPSPAAAKSATIPSDASALSEDTERDGARMARVEHGLVPEVRVKGESAGASIEDRLRVHHTAGVSVAIIHDYRVVSAKAYGVANATTGDRLTETTLMQAASVSKMFTALAALKEVEAGKIPLEANVNQTLRSWRLPDNELTRATPVTLKHLLSHTGGINVPSGPSAVIQEGRAVTAVELLEGKPPTISAPVRVDLAPGTKFRYSGGGMTVIQQMLIDVEGRPFPELMNDVVFAPLALSHSTFTQPLMKSERWPSVAAGHDYDGTTVVGGDFKVWVAEAAGGLSSTPADIAKLLIEMQLGLRGRSKVVSKEVASRMTTPVISIGEGDDVTMGLGPFVEKHGSGVYFGHDGYGIGFMTIARASTTGEGAVVMANSQASTPLMLEIFRSIAAEYAWEGWLMPPIDVARVDPAHLVALSGRYGGDSKESMLVAVKGDHLEARQPFREPLELLPLAADVFVSRADGMRFAFASNAAGVRSLVRTPVPWPPAGGPVTLARLPDGAPLEPLQLVESGRIDDALSAGKRLLKANPKDETVEESRLASIGEDLLNQRLDPKRAVPVLQLNFALHTQSPMACVNVAEALFRAGRRSEALAHYTKAKSLFARDRGAAMGERPTAFFHWKISRLKALDTPAK
jgi:CubicO group peptidase (beta-lactamase class C family)